MQERHYQSIEEIPLFNWQKCLEGDVKYVNLETKEDINLSLTAIWIRSMDKMQRLKQLILLNKNNSLDNEPVEDAYIDLSNYSIIALLVKAGKWKK